MIANVEDLKKKILPVAQKYNLSSIYLFGSRARGDAHQNSDFDFYVEQQNVLGMFELSGLFQDLQELLNCDVDIVVKPMNKNSKLDDYILDAIQQDGVLLYAR